MKRLAMLCVCAGLLLAGCTDQGDLRRRGMAAFQTGDFDTAQDMFQQVLGKAPFDAPSLYYMGRLHHANGNYEKAIFYYQCSIDSDPSNPMVHQWLQCAIEQAGPVGPMLRFIPAQPKVSLP